MLYIHSISPYFPITRLTYRYGLDIDVCAFVQNAPNHVVSTDGVNPQNSNVQGKQPHLKPKKHLNCYFINK